MGPTHFRNMLVNVRISSAGRSCVGEIQIHLAPVLRYNEGAHAHAHYEYFRSILADRYGDGLGGT